MTPQPHQAAANNSNPNARSHDLQEPAGSAGSAGPQGHPQEFAVGPDPTTGALMIPMFAQEYAKAILSHSYEDLAIWYLDIRNFRAVNPNHGFMQGNFVLKTLADNIKRILCHGLPVARLGADRFVPLTAGIDFEQAERCFFELVHTTNEQIAKEGVTNPLVLAAGIYYLREQDLANPNFQKPLDYVSVAHRNARNLTGNQLMLFTDLDLELDTRRIAIEQSIDNALAQGQIQVWYQPQIDYTYGEIVGAEALARWKHPELGWISPAEFIPVLENCGKVHALDLFVWEEACRSASQWRSVSDGKPVPISVNVSRIEMFEPGLMEHFLELQSKYDLPKGSLRLEVTESAFVEETERLYTVIEQMRQHDMLVEMDDFGSGLSSLNMLKDVPVDVVKLDMGFMRSSMSEDRGGVVLGSVIRMLQGLDTPIIAEGVETLEQAEMLKNMGCHLMQGYHFSRPMPLSEFEEFIATNHAVDTTKRRERVNSHLDELTSIDVSSSFIFNNAIGGMMYFFLTDNGGESILVNDAFYEECGLTRGVFGNTKINPLAEVDTESRSTLWRATAEAHECGSALCSATVRISQRRIDCVMRYIGPSTRGTIYSLNILRSHAAEVSDHEVVSLTQDLDWDLDLLDHIVPNGFIKCSVADDMAVAYISPALIPQSGLSKSEFTRRFHNSFTEMLVPASRIDLRDAVNECKFSGKPFTCDVTLHVGFGAQTRDAQIIGNVRTDKDGVPWIYALVLLTGEVESEERLELSGAAGNVIRFDLDLAADVLTIHSGGANGARTSYQHEHWLAQLEQLPQYITRSSAAKVLSTVNDVRQYPTPGFTDIKCNLRGSDEMRWYHINYSCETNETGQTCVIRGYAQDANDEMGSARWWRRQAEIDQLTGLLNRNTVEQEMNLAMRVQGAGMMFMIDLDGFKRVNDELGHLAGDALLRNVAQALSKNFGDSDILGRYGGDEFVAFAPISGHFPQNIAKQRAEAIIASVSAVRAEDRTHAACSVGVAISHSNTDTFYDLLEVADEALYHSKEAGRGCCTVLTVD